MPDWSPRADPTRYVPPGHDPNAKRKARLARWAIAVGAVSIGVAVIAELFV